jgi:hypothetical protein
MALQQLQCRSFIYKKDLEITFFLFIFAFGKQSYDCK